MNTTAIRVVLPVNNITIRVVNISIMTCRSTVTSLTLLLYIVYIMTTKFL